jgi:uncharacterized RDD family membrane protein YckC
MLEGKAVTGRRIKAYLVDTLIMLSMWLVGMVVGLGLGAAAIPFMQESEKFVPMIFTAWGGAFLGIGIGGIWFLIRDGFGGQSFGKRLFGLRVVSIATGEPAGKVDSFVRNIFQVINPLNLVEMIMLFADADAQRLGDKVRGLKVVGE